MVDWDSKLKKVESVVSSLLTSSFSVTTFLVITLISRVFDFPVFAIAKNRQKY